MNKGIVYTAGTWDLLHLGHLRFLKQAKRIADKFNAELVVGVSTDKLVVSYKKYMPVVSYKYRVMGINRCGYKTIKQTELISVELIKKIRPKAIVTIRKWKDLEGVKWARKNGIKIRYLQYTKGISSSMIRKRLNNANSG